MLCACASARDTRSWLQVLGVNACGSVKQDFYGLLCMRRAPKKEALFQELRGLVTRLNRALPGAERKCVPPHSSARTMPRYELADSFLPMQGALLPAGGGDGAADARGAA